MHLEISSAKWQQFCSCPNVLSDIDLAGWAVLLKIFSVHDNLYYSDRLSPHMYNVPVNITIPEQNSHYTADIIFNAFFLILIQL